MTTLAHRIFQAQRLTYVRVDGTLYRRQPWEPARLAEMFGMHWLTEDMPCNDCSMMSGQPHIPSCDNDYIYDEGLEAPQIFDHLDVEFYEAGDDLMNDPTPAELAVAESTTTGTWDGQRWVQSEKPSVWSRMSDSYAGWAHVTVSRKGWTLIPRDDHDLADLADVVREGYVVCIEEDAIQVVKARKAGGGAS